MFIPLKNFPEQFQDTDFVLEGITQRNVAATDNYTWVATVTLINPNFTFTDGEYNSETNQVEGATILSQSYWDVEWIINPLIAELSWSSSEEGFSYDGITKIVIAEVSNVIEGDTVRVTRYSTDAIDPNSEYYDYVTANEDGNKYYVYSATNVGVYCARAIQLSNRNYTLINCSTAEHLWEINQKTLTVTWGSQGTISIVDGVSTAVYAKSAIYYIPQVSGIIAGDESGVEVSITYKYRESSDVPWDSAQNIEASNCITVGEYRCEISITNGGDKYVLSSDDMYRTWTIVPRTLSFNWRELSATYTGQALSPQVTMVGQMSGDQVSVGEYRYTNASGETLTSVSAVGSYTVEVLSLTGNDSKNYTIEGSSNRTATFNIVPIRVSFEFTPSTNDWTYNGQPKYYEPTGLKGILSGEQVSFNLTYTYRNVAGVLSSTPPSGPNYCVNAGTYTVTVSLTGNNAGNYSLEDYSVEALTRTWTIQQRVVTFTWGNVGDTVVGGVYRYQYTGESIRIEAAVVNNGGPQEDNVTVGEYALNEFVSCGNYVARVVSLDAANSNNYTFDTAAASTQQAWAIVAKELAIQDISWQYNGGLTSTTLEHEYSGEEISIIPSILSSSLVEVDRDRVYLQYSITRNDVGVSECIDVGTYTVEITGIGGESAGNYSINNLQEQETGLSMSWQITQREIYYTYDKSTAGSSISGNSLVATYSGSAIRFGVLLQNTIASDNVYPLYSYTAGGEQQSNLVICSLTQAGNYTANLTLGGSDASNYVLAQDYTQALFRVLQVELTLSGDWTPTSFSYTGENQYPTITINGVQPGDMPYEYAYRVETASGSFTDMTANTVPSRAGSYQIELRLTQDGQINYAWASDVTIDMRTFEFQINPIDVNYEVIPLHMGSSDTEASVEDRTTTVLVVLYGANGQGASRPTGNIWFYNGKNGTQLYTGALLTSYTVGTYPNYENIISARLVGNYAYAIFSYTEANSSRYLPALSFTSDSNDLQGTLYTNYNSFTNQAIVDDIEDSQFIPSGQTQNPLYMYYLDPTSVEGSPSYIIANGQLIERSYVYGDTMILFIVGGSRIGSTSNPNDGFRLSMGNLGVISAGQQITQIGNGVAPCEVTYVTGSSDSQLSAFIEYYKNNNRLIITDK